jgi:hypothetical protein
MKSLSDLLFIVAVSVMASVTTNSVLSLLAPKPAAVASEPGCHCGKSPTTPPGKVIGDMK